MAREERDPYDTRATRSARRSDTEPTDRLGGGGRPPADPVNPDWRGSRVTRRNTRAQGLPSSRQEFVVWLQYGGWRVVAVAAGLVLLLVLMIYVSRMPRQALPTSQPTEVASGQGAGVATLPVLPSPTAGPLSPTAAPAPNPGGGAQFRVVNTGPDGLFLRPEHNTDRPPVKTLAEGAVVTIIGQDFSGPDRVWKKVRDAEGSEGWVAADFLQAVQ